LLTKKPKLNRQDPTEPVVPDTDAGLERIKRLEQQLALKPGRSSGRRALAQAVRIEAHLYRKSLDVGQAAATRSKTSERAIKKVT
jgi:hypothetical protein